MRKLISKVNRSNPLNIYVEKKKSDFENGTNYYHDFKVRWNTTYVMMTRFIQLKQVVNDITCNSDEIPNISVLTFYFLFNIFCFKFSFFKRFKKKS